MYAPKALSRGAISPSAGKMSAKQTKGARAVPSAHTGRVWNGVHWQLGKSLQQCGNCKITARIPHPTSLRSATFSPGEGIWGASDKRYDKYEFKNGQLNELPV